MLAVGPSGPSRSARITRIISALADSMRTDPTHASGPCTKSASIFRYSFLNKSDCENIVSVQVMMVVGPSGQTLRGLRVFELPSRIPIARTLSPYKSCWHLASRPLKLCADYENCNVGCNSSWSAYSDYVHLVQLQAKLAIAPGMPQSAAHDRRPQAVDLCRKSCAAASRRSSPSS
jgi:hypothetical protein